MDLEMPRNHSISSHRSHEQREISDNGSGSSQILMSRVIDTPAKKRNRLAQRKHRSNRLPTRQNLPAPDDVLSFPSQTFLQRASEFDEKLPHENESNLNSDYESLGNMDFASENPNIWTESELDTVFGADQLTYPDMITTRSGWKPLPASTHLSLSERTSEVPGTGSGYSSEELSSTAVQTRFNNSYSMAISDYQSEGAGNMSSARKRSATGMVQFQGRQDFDKSPEIHARDDQITSRDRRIPQPINTSGFPTVGSRNLGLQSPPEEPTDTTSNSSPGSSPHSEHRFGVILAAVEAAGFSSLDEMAMEYYTATIPEESPFRSTQSLSRSRQLKDLLQVLDSSSTQWSGQENKDYRGGISKSAQAIFAQELEELKQKDFRDQRSLDESLVLQYTQFSPPHGHAPRAFLNLQTSMQDIRRLRENFKTKTLQMPETWSTLMAFTRQAGVPTPLSSQIVSAFLRACAFIDINERQASL
ncbi:uncharacterized protein RCO7_01152 [Rhynchosporium graminicola]|uniref:BZIP domain-containing protein n=1 Tax=Rhynchosporium graminicola TaxID=2792576 RepID=A0A1E1JR19_9HELO|nr:uncharacterized protein RCO7_01152 [Rhynchosporium commune]